MNRAPDNLIVPKAIDLATEADFTLGDLRFRPALRQVQAAGRCESVEPRVMQVLVALMRSRGVVSRDQLIDLCWGGRLVGDDAINSCMAKVRGLAALSSPPAFEIETVPRVGYRLRPKAGVALEAAPLALAAADAPAAAKRRFARSGAIAAAVLALIAAAAAVVGLWPRPQKHWEVVESHQPFISTPDLERYPNFSPDGTMIAYVRGKNIWTQHIFIQLMRGGDPLELTPDGTNAFSPKFSPDGTSVAYVGFQEKRPCKIFLAQIPSGPSREIGHCRRSELTMLSWDRGGHALFYYDKFNTGQFLHIVRYDIDTGTTTEVTRSGEHGSTSDYDPSASPDGKSLLFFRYLQGDRLQIVLLTLKNGAERVLADGDADKYAAWSQDSSTVFVVRNQGSDSSLWSYPVSGAAPSRITSNSRPMEELASGPDGLLAFQLKDQAKELAVASPAAAQTSRTLDASGFDACAFDYAADGTLALIANKGEAQVVAVGVPGSMREIMSIKGNMACGIRWSPDETKLAIVSGDDSGFRVSIVDRAGMPVTQVDYPTKNVGSFEWTADGKGLLQARLDDRGWRIWRADLLPEHIAVPVSSYGWKWFHGYKGMMFAMRSDAPGIWRIDGRAKRLTAYPSVDRFWAWTVAADKILYVDLTHPGQRSIAAQPIAGGPQTIAGYANDMDFYSPIAVNPKDGQITYSRDLRDDPDIGWIRLARR
jgi:Tol biopolymer transport system component/DNA-binding winged helix-turn-helix (wHTH) protein